MIHEKKAIERGKAYEKELFTGGRIDTYSFYSAPSVMAENMDSVKSVFGIPLLGVDFSADLAKSPVYLNQTLNEFITMQRDGAWGNDTYREAGNTAIIRLDSFMPDEEAWDLYYKGEGDFPIMRSVVSCSCSLWFT